MGRTPTTIANVANETGEAVRATTKLIQDVDELANTLLTSKFGVKPPGILDPNVEVYSRKTSLYYVHGYDSTAVKSATESLVGSIGSWKMFTNDIINLADAVVKSIVGGGEMTLSGECKGFTLTDNTTGYKYKFILVINLVHIAAEKYLIKQSFQMYDHFFLIYNMGKAESIVPVGDGSTENPISVVEKPNGDHDFVIGGIEFNDNGVQVKPGTFFNRQLRQEIEDAEGLLNQNVFTRAGPEGNDFTMSNIE
jgi:hypothetical protein